MNFQDSFRFLSLKFQGFEIQEIIFVSIVNPAKKGSKDITQGGW